LLPLRALEAVDLQREQVALQRAASASAQARLVAFLGTILALGAGLGFAIYASRLVRLFTRQAHALEQTLAEREQAHVALQESEGLLRQSQKMEAVGLLAGGVAHDFNNVLTAITGYNDLARADVRPDQHELRDNIDQVKSAATLAGALTAQLLAFSRKEVVQSRVVEIDALLEELAAMLRPLLGARIELVLDLDASEASVEADPVQLQQVVMNLAINARDAMPDGGRVTISVAGLDLTDPSGMRPAGRYVQIAVSDTGTGMDEETLSRAFDPFFTTKEEGKGTGLGLATVHGIVTQSGGDIQVTSEPGEGTTFSICLPRTDAVREETTPQRKPARSARHRNSPGRRRPTCRPLSIA
jgi:signal transduction histidine kinase